MDNVVLKQTIPSFFEVIEGGLSKRLKIKPKSEENIENKIIKFSAVAIDNSMSDMQDDAKKEVKEVTPASNVNVSVVGSGDLILDNIKKDDVVNYLQPFPFISKKPIRLNDSMYVNFKGRSLDSRRNLFTNSINSSTSDAVVQSVSTENVSIPSSVGVSPIIDTASVDTE